MNKWVLLPLIISGCSNVEYIRISKMPNIPIELLQPCENLIYMNESQNMLSDVISITITNSNKYYKCKLKQGAMIKWYKENKRMELKNDNR